MKRDPRERDVLDLHFTFQRLGNISFIPHVLERIVLGWDASLPTTLQRMPLILPINRCIFRRWMSVFFGPAAVSGANFFPSKCSSVLRHWAFSHKKRPREKVWNGYRNTRNIENSIVQVC